MKGIPKLVGCGIAISFFTLKIALVPNPSFSQVGQTPLPLPESPFTSSQNDMSSLLNNNPYKTAPILPEESPFEKQEQQKRAILRQQQNWSTHDDPILGIQFNHPSWWDKIDLTSKNSIEFYDNPSTHASVNYILPPLPEEMNTLDKFMRQEMTLLRPPDAQNLSVNKSSTIGVDDIPAYKVESEETLGGVATMEDLHVRNIHYLAIDNKTGTGYMISFDTSSKNPQEEVPLFERMVESFKILG